MNKQEAEHRLIQGEKIYHIKFQLHEFLYLENGIIYTENGYLGGGLTSLYWTIKPMQGWEIYDREIIEL